MMMMKDSRQEKVKKQLVGKKNRTKSPKKSSQGVDEVGMYPVDHRQAGRRRWSLNQKMKNQKRTLKSQKKNQSLKRIQQGKTPSRSQQKGRKKVESESEEEESDEDEESDDDFKPKSRQARNASSRSRSQQKGRRKPKSESEEEESEEEKGRKKPTRQNARSSRRQQSEEEDDDEDSDDINSRRSLRGARDRMSKNKLTPKIILEKAKIPTKDKIPIKEKEKTPPPLSTSMEIQEMTSSSDEEEATKPCRYCTQEICDSL